MRQPLTNLQFSKDKLVVQSAAGHTTVQQLTAECMLNDTPPELKALHDVAHQHTPATSTFQKPTEYHNILRFKQTPGPDPPYDQQVWKLEELI